jgi:hypothetical protein
MRRLRDTLLGNALMAEPDISIFENLEQSARINLGEIAQREEKAIAKGKLAVKENITAEQRGKIATMSHEATNTVDVDALSRIVT